VTSAPSGEETCATLIPRRRLTDDRGWFLKVLTGQEDGLAPTVGECYFTHALPGEWRGNHYHPLAAEWFTVISGAATLTTLCRSTGRRREYHLSAEEPTTVHVPAGLGHVFVNAASAEEPFLLFAYSDRVYDPADTIMLEIVRHA
jgi:dTDP-4-dehydrorhamnose 3,5-epimerase-like enzyme